MGFFAGGSVFDNLCCVLPCPFRFPDVWIEFACLAVSVSKHAKSSISESSLACVNQLSIFLTSCITCHDLGYEMSSLEAIGVIEKGREIFSSFS